jgi:hypothetical protein
VAYLKFSRDKRGYEHFYLLQPSNRGKSRPRMLYWFRTPPGVKVGRSPFEPDMRRALEAQNPDVVFDWEGITRTPIPPPVEPERWRERRRIERAGRAAEAEESASLASSAEQPAKSELMTVEPTEEPPFVEIGELNAGAEPQAASDPILAPESPESPIVTSQDGAARQGHRRRRRRGRRKPQVQGSGFTVQGSPVQGSPVQGSEPPGSKAQEPVIQDSGDPEDENHEP